MTGNDNPEEDPGMSDNCIHANTVPAYTVSGAKGTLVVEKCSDCGVKTGATLVQK